MITLQGDVPQSYSHQRWHCDVSNLEIFQGGLENTDLQRSCNSNIYIVDKRQSEKAGPIIFRQVFGYSGQACDVLAQSR